MTLAFHGKSRKRQQALLFAAFLAIIIGALAGANAWRSQQASAAPVEFFYDDLDSEQIPLWEKTGNVIGTGGAAELSGNGSAMTRTVSTAGYSDVVLKVTCRGVAANESSQPNFDQLHVEFSGNGGQSWAGTGFVTSSSTGGCTVGASNTVSVAMSSVYGVFNNPDVMIRLRSGNHDDADEKVIIEAVWLEGEPSLVTMELFPGELQTQVGWPVRFYNAGPATTVKLDVNYAPNGTTTNLAGTNGPVSNCNFSSNIAWLSCDVQLNASNVNGGMTQVTFYTTAPPDDCNDTTVNMTVAGMLGGNDIPARLGKTLSNEYTKPGSFCEYPITVDKLDEVDLVGDGAYVEWTIWLHNSDDQKRFVHVSDPGATLVASNCVGGDTAVQNEVISCEVPPGDAGGQPEGTLTVRTDFNPTPYEECKGGTRTNTATLVALNEPNLGEDTATAFVRPELPGAHCASVAKSYQGDGVWDITFVNTGPATYVTFSDTFEAPMGVIEHVTLNGFELNCPYNPDRTMVYDCAVNLPSGVDADSTVTVKVETDWPNACTPANLRNTVTAHLGLAPVTVVPLVGSPAVVELTTEACKSVVRLCKSWTIDGILEQGDPDPQDFQFAVRDTSAGKGEPDTIVTIPGVMEGEGPYCINLEVNRGLVSFDEVGPAPGFVFDGWTWQDGSQSKDPPLDGDYRPLMLDVSEGYCQYPVGALTGELLGLVREVSSVVIFEGEPGTVACTITFYNHDTDDRLPTGNLRVEKYLDLNGDGDADDPGEGLIEGSFEMKKAGDPVADLWDMPGGTRTFTALNAGDNYEIVIGVSAQWKVTNATLYGYAVGATANVTAEIPDGGTIVVRFYQQPPEEPATPTATPTAPTSTATATASPTASPTATETPPPAGDPQPPVQHPQVEVPPTSTPTPRASGTVSPVEPPSSETPGGPATQAPPTQGGGGSQAPVTIVAGEQTAGPEPTPVAPSTGSGGSGPAAGTNLSLLAGLLLAASGLVGGLSLALRPERGLRRGRRL